MISTWTLVVIVWMGNATTSISVPGYSSKEKCLNSATKTIKYLKEKTEVSDFLGRFEYVCVEVN